MFYLFFLRRDSTTFHVEKVRLFLKDAFMKKKKMDSNIVLKISLISVLFVAMAIVVVVKTDVLKSGDVHADGLSGLVSVKGTVKVEDLNLSLAEVKKINRAVSTYKDTFSQVDLFLDAKKGIANMNGKTILVMAMVLETNGECEVRSWSRKVSRNDLVSQIVLYMNKAAKEYDQFKKYPDVTQNFKCLYI